MKTTIEFTMDIGLKRFSPPDTKALSSLKK